MREHQQDDSLAFDYSASNYDPERINNLIDSVEKSLTHTTKVSCPEELVVGVDLGTAYIEKQTGVPTHKPANPFLVTPLGIAISAHEAVRKEKSA